VRQVYGSLFQRKLAEAIELRLGHIREEVCSNNMLSFDHYKFNVGILEGLRIVRDELFAEADIQANEE
jgi:hypothetical protein